MWYILSTVIMGLAAAKYASQGTLLASLFLLLMWSVLTGYLMGVRV